MHHGWLKYKSPVAGIEIDRLLEPRKQRKERREHSDPHIRFGMAMPSPMVPPSPPSLKRGPPRSADPCGATTGLAGSAASVTDRTFMRHL
jgi:hypothetical protein